MQIFHQLEDLQGCLRGSSQRKSFVVHSGEDRYPVTKEIEAIGLRELAELLGTEGA